MDELRMVRREEGCLILANELGEEYRLVVDDTVATEVRQLARRSAPAGGVRPREIQALLRAGKSRSEVAEETGLEEADVERYEEPVRAEQRYMLELAHSITVRTDPSRDGQQEEQRFGGVIAERLIGIGNRKSEWRAWRDETTGWLVGLVFDSRDGEHDAIWSLDHRKRVLSPLNPDATSLSKAGEVGDRLIPKLRAVDNDQRDRFDSDAFDPDALLAETSEENSVDEPSTDRVGAPLGDSDAEYERRREIDHLAVKTPQDPVEDLGQTADLLDALRRRRGERGQGPASESEHDSRSEHPSNQLRTGQIPTLWGDGDAGDRPHEEQRSAPRLRAVDPIDDFEDDEASAERSDEDRHADIVVDAPREDSQGSKPAKKGRSSIPSWDDILFGTRSDDDPA